MKSNKWMIELHREIAAYDAVITELENRIRALIPKHPEILRIGYASGLLNILEFRHEDLRATENQVHEAFERVMQKQGVCHEMRKMDY